MEGQKVPVPLRPDLDLDLKITKNMVVLGLNGSKMTAYFLKT